MGRTGTNQGQVAIVTGGASGIGRALGAALVSRAAHVVLADVDGDALRSAAESLNDEGPGRAQAIELDVADAEAVRRLIEDTYREQGRLDFLFNNAGIGVGGEPEELSLAHWERALDVNVRGVIHGCHAAYPLMQRQGFGHIVNTASTAGLIPTPGQFAPYAMTKHAVVGLSLALRAAGAEAGIHVHVVCPGVIETPILDKKEIPGLPTPPAVENLDLRKFFRDAGFRNFYPAERLAEDVLDGLARDQAIIVSPAEARMAWRLARLAPGWAMKLATRGTRMGRKQRAASP